MTAIGFVLFQIFLIFIAAQIAGEIFRKIHQPVVIGELLIGVILGPFALGWIAVPGPALLGLFSDAHAAEEALHLVLHTIGELGAIVLLFVVGMETRLRDLVQVGARASMVAILGVVFPFALGYGFMVVYGGGNIEAMFVATAMVATSVGITARVLEELGFMGAIEAKIILAAAVIDDVLGLLLLTMVTAMAGPGSISLSQTGIIVVQALGFVVFVTLVVRHYFDRHQGIIAKLGMPDPPMVLALGGMIGLAGLASYFGLAAIIGAFLAGMVFAELSDREGLKNRIQPLYHFLVPFFFVLTGSQVDWRVFGQGDVMVVAGAVTALAIIGKLGAGMLAGIGMKTRSLFIVGVGMVPRGEVGLIVASLGLSLGVINDRLFSIVVIMAVVTTLIAPPLLKWLFKPLPAID
jgi:Kef-type K+ transport system membrane component KefB